MAGGEDERSGDEERWLRVGRADWRGGRERSKLNGGRGCMRDQDESGGSDMAVSKKGDKDGARVKVVNAISDGVARRSNSSVNASRSASPRDTTIGTPPIPLGLEKMLKRMRAAHPFDIV